MVAKMREREVVVAALDGHEADLLTVDQDGERGHIVQRPLHPDHHPPHRARGLGTCHQEEGEKSRSYKTVQGVGSEARSSSQSRSSEVQRNQMTAMVPQMRRPPPSFMNMPATVWSATGDRPQARAASPYTG